LLSLPPEKAASLFSALQYNLNHHLMLISFSAADELQTVKTLGWSGALLQPNCPTQLQAEKCLVDVVAQVEANVGVNKTNYQLTRKVDHSIALNATEAAHHRQITWNNNAQTNSWPKGAYKVFTRLYLPSSARFETVAVNGKKMENNLVS